MPRSPSRTTMFGALTRTFTRSTDAGCRHSAAIDAQLAVDHIAKRNTVHILVLGQAGGGKSALLRLLVPDGDVPDVTGESLPRDRGVDEDGGSAVSPVTLTPSDDYVPGQQDMEGKVKGKSGVLNRRTADSINEVLLEGPSTLRLLFVEVPSTLTRKVMHRLEDRASAVVYPLDLSSYADKVPAAPWAPLSPHPEPALPNQLQASLDVLESLVRNPRFRPNVVIVMLTKADRLAVKLQVTPFRDFFPAFEGEETVRGVGEFVLTQLSQLGSWSPGRKLCVCPAVLNLVEEDTARRAATRAGVLAFVTNMTLRANLMVVSCLGSGMPEEELEIADVVFDKVAKAAWEGVVLEGWVLKNRRLD